MKKILTKRQVEVLNKIKEYLHTKNEYPSLRALGKLIDIKSPNGVKRHIDALIKKGYFKDENNKYSLVPETNDYIDIRVLGYANAGLPLAIAEENQIGTITIKATTYKVPEDIFAVIIEGNSMNIQEINGKKLLNNSYAIIKREHHFKDGDTVLAVIDNSATIKNIVTRNGYIVLYPNSDDNRHREIYISEEEDFYINGKVIDVLPLIVK
jgi:repressor LexA